MRRAAVLLIVLAAACGGPRASGPAWPKMTESESDGGESLAPHARATSVAAASGDDDDDDDIKVVIAPVTATPAAAAATTPATAPTVTSPDDPLTVEEITIEISDD